MDIKLQLLIIINVLLNTQANILNLTQVVILSRHNLRTPLGTNLDEITPNVWPKWKEKPGYLTDKGALLEGYMGEFFSAWLKEEKLLRKTCPGEDFFVYTNVKERTRRSAKEFVDKAFPGCNVTIHHSPTDSDPIFNPFFHNSTTTFKHLAWLQMEEKLNSLKDLKGSYNEIERILDYEKSELCKRKKKCDMADETNTILNVTVGEKPNVVGPMKLSNSAIDAFTMQYYEGFPLKDVAWGQLSTLESWEDVTKISKGYHNVIFNTTLVAKDLARPLIKYLTKIFIEDNKKVALLMGHDANLYTVLASLNFKPYVLKNQYELIPVGGKLVFQKWYDLNANEYYLKINYVYQSMEQMRSGKPLSLDNPPEFQMMELNGCKLNLDGLCPWNDFVKILQN